MKLSYSRLSVWQACQQKYRWIYDEGLEPKEVSESLEFGRTFHKLMEGKEIVSMDKDSDIALVYADYQRTYEGQALSYKPIVKIEKELKLEGLWLDTNPQVYMVGYIDKAVFYEDGSVDLVDYKTAAQFPSQEMLAYRPQAQIYWWLLQENYPECTPGNFIWDFIKNKPASVPRRLKTGGLSSDVRGVIPASVARAGWSLDMFSEDKQKEILSNENNYFKRVVCPFDETIFNNAIKGLKAASTQLGTIGTLNIRDDFHIYNVGRDCDWCEYAPLCRLAMSGADTEEYIERAFVKREERNV